MDADALKGDEDVLLDGFLSDSDLEELHGIFTDRTSLDDTPK